MKNLNQTISKCIEFPNNLALLNFVKCCENALWICVVIGDLLCQIILTLFLFTTLLQVQNQNIIIMSFQNLVGSIFNNIKLIKVIGKGTSAIVYEGVDLYTNQKVAVKAIPIKILKQTPKRQELVQTEIKLLKSCKNQNIIKHITSFKSSKNIFIVTEFCDGGDLQDYLNLKKRLPQQEATNYLKQILNGFKGLHEVRAMHRDFKPQNLLFKQNELKIADLGFAKQLDQKQGLTKTQLGTSLTMAPEVFDKKFYGMYADIWSIGVVYYLMLVGEYPFVGLSDIEIRTKIDQGRKPYPSSITISQNAKDFIDRCLIIDPKYRISWAEIYNHPLLTMEYGKQYKTSVSKIKLQENKDYYIKNESETAKQYNEVEKQYFITAGYEPHQYLVESFKEQLFQKVGQQNQLKQKEQSIVEYGRNLQKKRNNIMFMFKYFIQKIAPYIHLISANHNLPLFFICKRTLIQIEAFISELSQKQVSSQNEASVLQLYLNSKYSQVLLNLLLQDSDMIASQSLIYKEGIHGNQQIQKQLQNITTWKCQNWKQLMNQILDQYWHQIVENIDSNSTEKLYYVLKALEYYQQSDDINTEVFDIMLETLVLSNYKAEVEKKLFY